MLAVSGLARAKTKSPAAGQLTNCGAQAIGSVTDLRLVIMPLLREKFTIHGLQSGGEVAGAVQAELFVAIAAGWPPGLPVARGASGRCVSGYHAGRHPKGRQSTRFSDSHRLLNPSAFDGSTASKGPRPFDRGRLRPSGHSSATGAGFNGSTAFRPWETASRMNTSPGRKISLQWVHGLSTVGDRAGGVARRDLRPGFNGSTAFRPWETWRDHHRRHLGHRLLQWVHGLSTVGDWPHPLLLRRRRRASMGPRPFDRGRRCSMARARAMMPASFNGSTAFRPWETRGDLLAELVGTRLQWVHGLSTVGDFSSPAPSVTR